MKRFIALIIVCAMFLCCACSGGDKKSSADKKNDYMVDDGIDDTPAIKTETAPTAQVTQSAAVEEEVVKAYPKIDAKSYYYKFIEDVPEDVLIAYDESDEVMQGYLGKPYKLDGTVVKVFADMQELSDTYNYSEVLNNSGYDESVAKSCANSFILRTDSTDVLILNCQSDLIASVKENYKDDLMTLKTYKVVYNKLADYTEYPEEGEKVTVYGFYTGFEKRAEMPSFTYGISKLTRDCIFGTDYAQFRTDDKRSMKYKNYVDFEMPESWSDVLESSDAHYYFFDGGNIMWDNYENKEKMSVKDFVNWYYNGFDGEEGLTVISEEFTTVAEGKAECFWLKYAYNMGASGMTHNEILVFECRGRIILLQFSCYENSNSTDIILEDFYRLVDSIRLRSA